MKLTRMRLAEMQIPKTLLNNWMKQESFHEYKPKPINEFSDKDVEMCRKACETLISTSPP